MQLKQFRLQTSAHESDLQSILTANPHELEENTEWNLLFVSVNHAKNWNNYI